MNRMSCGTMNLNRRTNTGYSERQMMENRSQCPERRMMENRSDCRDRRMAENSNSTEISSLSRKQLFCFINEVSFAAYEALLYLDTHPDDQEAMEFFREHNRLREHALKEYARLYGPLTISTANDHESQCWEWMNQPWPWEGGDC